MMTDRQLKAAATRAGLGVNEYLDRLNAGLVYCHRDQDWHAAEAFAIDERRPAGRAASCLASARAARCARVRWELRNLAERRATLLAEVDLIEREIARLEAQVTEGRKPE